MLIKLIDVINLFIKFFIKKLITKLLSSNIQIHWLCAMSNRFHKHTLGDYLPQSMKQPAKSVPKKKPLPKPILIYTEGMDLKPTILQALKDLNAVSVESSVNESLVVYMILYGGIDFNFDDFSQPDKVYHEWLDRIYKVLKELHQERLVVYGFKSVYSVYSKWYLELNPPSARKSFGNLGRHDEWWNT